MSDPMTPPTGAPVTPGAPPAVAKKSHKLCWSLAAVAAVIVVGGVIAAASGGSSSSTAAPIPAASAPTQAAPTQAAPTQAAGPVVLLTAKGNGIKNLPAFTTTGSWTLTYAYDCHAFGMSGNFAVYDGGDTPGVYANELGMKGGDTQSLDATGRIKLQVNSECAWSLKAVQQ